MSVISSGLLFAVCMLHLVEGYVELDPDEVVCCYVVGSTCTNYVGEAVV